MKNRLTALAISVIIICTCVVSCSKKNLNLHTFEAKIGEEPFKATYLAEKSDGTPMTEEEISEIDSALAAAVTDSLEIFSEGNSEGVEEINKPVDAVLDCNEELIKLVEYTYSLTETTKGAYQPVMGAVAELYTSVEEITPEALAEALTHTGNKLITIEGDIIRKSDREAKLYLDNIVAGFVLRDVSAVLASKNVVYSVITYRDSTATFGSAEEDEAVDMAVYLSGDNSTHSGVLSYNDAVATVYNSSSLVFNNNTGEKVTSEFDTIIVLSPDAVFSNVIADIVYGMSEEQIMKLYNEGYLDFEAVMIYADGSFAKTSDEIVYEKTVNE